MGLEISANYEMLVNFATVFQLLFFILTLLVVRKYHQPGIVPLIGILIAFLLGKADDLWQQTGLILRYPDWAFTGSVFSFLQGPLIYLYVRTRTTPNLKLHWSMAVHGAWVLPIITWMVLNWWRLDSSEKISLLQGGGLANLTNLVLLPSYFDCVLIFYLILSVKLVKSHGIRLKEWFSNIQDRNLSGIRHLLSLFAAMVTLHLLWTLGRYFFLSDLLSVAVVSLLVTYHLVLVNGLFLEFVTHPPVERDEAVDAGAEPGSASEPIRLPDSELDQCLSGLDRLMMEERVFLDPDLALKDLAKPLRVHPRTLSQLINRVHQCNFYEFVNRFRIEHAKALIRNEPEKTILHIAYDSGFNSKSAFNTAFKRYVQLTPSGYRRSLVDD